MAKKGSGKRKGNAYERRIASVLGEWLYADKTVLYRPSNSGSRATVLKSIGLEVHPGDIVPAKKGALDFPLAVECKNEGNYRGVWTFDELLKDNRSKLLSWWAKLVGQAGDRFIPCMILKKNFYPDVFVIETKYTVSRGFNLIDCVSFIMPNVEDPIEDPHIHISFFPLADVIQHVDGSDYRRHLASLVGSD
jgi:hypothetical protein